MNPDQFTAFIQAEQADRAATRDAKLQQHQQRQSITQQTATCQKAEGQAKRVPACDGATTKAVREWSKGVGLTIPYSTERSI